MTTTRALPPVERPSWGRPVPAASARRWWRPATAPHIALAFALMAAYTLVSALRYQRFDSQSWDLAIFTEAVKAYAHLHAPTVPMKGAGYNILGDHFSPVTALIAPLFRLWPDAFLLLVVQAALFAWSAGVVSDTAARHLGRSRGLCIGIAYGLSFGIQRAVDADFHEIAFAVPLLAVVCRQLLAKRWQRAAWWALPLLLVKEDLGLTVAVVGVLLIVLGRRRALGGLLTVGGLLVTGLLIWWVIPHFNPTGTYDYWAKVGGHPHWSTLTWQAVKRLETWKTLGWTLGITGFLALRSPLLLLAVPTLAWRLTSTNAAFWGTGWHYSAVLMPIVFLAVVDAASRAEASRRPRLRRYADRTITSLPAIALACMAGMTYGVGGLADAGAWSGGATARDRAAAISRIPDGATVESTKAVMAQLSARTDVYWYGSRATSVPEYVVYDRADWHDGPQPADAAARAESDHRGGTYRVVFNRHDITVVELQK